MWRQLASAKKIVTQTQNLLATKYSAWWSIVVSSITWQFVKTNYQWYVSMVKLWHCNLTMYWVIKRAYLKLASFKKYRKVIGQVPTQRKLPDLRFYSRNSFSIIFNVAFYFTVKTKFRLIVFLVFSIKRKQKTVFNVKELATRKKGLLCIKLHCFYINKRVLKQIHFAILKTGLLMFPNNKLVKEKERVL